MNTRPAIINPKSHKPVRVTAANPIIAGAPPENPPRIIFS